MENLTLINRISKWARGSITLKLFTIGFLIAVLLIPTAMAGSLVKERKNRKNTAVREINSKWGVEQMISGPILTVPFKISKYSTKMEYLHFLPEDLIVTGDITTEIRKRGIYEAVVYNTKANLKGSFSFPDVKKLNSNIDKSLVLWDEAFISFNVSDIRGLKNKVMFKWNDSEMEMFPGIKTNQVFSSGISTQVVMAPEIKKYEYDMDIDLNGSSELFFLPVGSTTEVKLDSSWTNPSFDGDFLPESHDISDSGFTASWKVFDFNRNFTQAWRGVDKNQGSQKWLDMGSGFGVKLLLEVDEYQKNTRSVKYAILFIVLTFFTFFFLEITNKKGRIHPFQYLLIGFAVVLFYILLLSLSEYMAFNFAYLIASLGTIGLITLYSKSVLKNNRFAVLVGLILVLMYSFFYLLLQLQDLSLLLGSIALFIILAVIMYLSRNINWYSVSKEE